MGPKTCRFGTSRRSSPTPRLPSTGGPVPPRVDQPTHPRRSRPSSSKSSPTRRQRSSRLARQIVEERFVGLLACWRWHRVLLPPGRDALAERDCFRDPIQLGLNRQADSILLGKAAFLGELRHQFRCYVV